MCFTLVFALASLLFRVSSTSCVTTRRDNFFLWLNETVTINLSELTCAFVFSESNAKLRRPKQLMLLPEVPLDPLVQWVEAKVEAEVKRVPRNP